MVLRMVLFLELVLGVVVAVMEDVVEDVMEGFSVSFADVRRDVGLSVEELQWGVKADRPSPAVGELS